LELKIKFFLKKIKISSRKLIKRIEDYQKLNKEWEFKVNNIRTNIGELEEDNKSNL
jgi:hypothetical protein